MAELENLNWRVLNEEAQVACDRDGIVAILYTVQSGAMGGHPVVEVCWLPVANPSQVEVLFGASKGAHDAWASRWERGQAAVAQELAARSISE